MVKEGKVAPSVVDPLHAHPLHVPFAHLPRPSPLQHPLGTSGSSMLTPLRHLVVRGAGGWINGCVAPPPDHPLPQGAASLHTEQSSGAEEAL